MKTLRILSILLVLTAFCACRPVKQGKGCMTNNDLCKIREIQQHAFGYFTHSIGTNGLVQDRMSDPVLSSTMAAGFQLTCYCIAAERQWISRETAANYVLSTLNTYAKLPRFHGMYAHFYDIRSGKVVALMHKNDDGADVSETGFMMAGVLACRNYFTNNTPRENEIRKLATQLYEDVEWDWMLQDANGSELKTLSWHWSPKCGFRVGSAQRVRSNLELSSMITYLLAMTSPTHPIPYTCWNEGWCNDYQWGSFDGYTLISRPALFNHQYAQTWLDLRNSRDRHADYFRNSTYASLANCSYCTTNLYPTNYIWGLTYCDGPYGYGTYGYPPKQGPIDSEATIAPTGPGGSFVFTPAQSLRAMLTMRNNYPQLWGPYGFYDAFSPKLSWFDQDYVAIDQGPLIMMPENYISEFVWDLFMTDTNLIHTLDQIGFVGIIDDMEGHTPYPLKPDPNPFPDNLTNGGLAPYCHWKARLNCTLEYVSSNSRIGRQALAVTPSEPSEHVISAFPANRNMQRYEYLSIWLLNNPSPILTIEQNGLIKQLPRVASLQDASGWERIYFKLPKELRKGHAELRIHSQMGSPWFMDDIILCNQADTSTPPPAEAPKLSSGIAPGEVTMSWQCPPLSNQPSPYRYLLKTSPSPILDASSFRTATDASSFPQVRIRGTATNWIITGLQPGIRHWFALQTESLNGNVSDIVSTNILLGNLPAPRSISLLNHDIIHWQPPSHTYSNLTTSAGGLSFDYNKTTQADRWAYLQGVLQYHDLSPFNELTISYTGNAEIVPKLWSSENIQLDIPIENVKETSDGLHIARYNLSSMAKKYTECVRKCFLFVHATNTSGSLTIKEIKVLK